MNLYDKQRQYTFFPWSVQEQVKAKSIKRAKGVWLELDNGKKILDFSSQLFNANIGHGHPRVASALRDFAQEDISVSNPQFVEKHRALLGEKLAQVAPAGMRKAFFCNGGAEANENAIKMAFLMTGGYKIITHAQSYHGATLSTISASGDYRREKFDFWSKNVIRIPNPQVAADVNTTIVLIEKLIRAEGPKTVACMLVEPITGANGVLIPPDAYWPALRNLCDKYGILLIADEVFTGFGRTGTWFAVNHFNTVPDLMTIAKGLTGGYAPLGAVLANEKVTQFFEKNMLWCGLTNYANPLCCAVANAVVDVYTKDALIENAHRIGLLLADELKKLQSEFSFIKAIRSKGLLAALDIDESKIPNSDAGKVLQNRLWDEGLQIVVREGRIIIAPPLCLTQEELMRGIDILRKVI